MKRNQPFNTPHIGVRNNRIIDPVVQVVENKDNTETVIDMRQSDFLVKNPPSTEDFKLEDLIKAGVPLSEVPTKIYGSNDPNDAPYSQNQILDIVEREFKKADTVKDGEVIE